MTRDFITIDALSNDELDEIYDAARRPIRGDELRGASVAMVFEYPSLRTRASSWSAVQQLGARGALFTGDEVGLDVRECAEDVARTLLATADVAALRVRDHGVFARMSRATQSHLRLINLLSNHEHPTQAVADVLSFADAWSAGDVHQLAGHTLTYVGDANNVTRSIASAFSRLGVRVVVAAPHGYQFSQSEVAHFNAAARFGGCVELSNDPRDAASGAQALYTDVWVSMGQDSDAAQRRRDLKEFQINADLVARADPKVIVMHCLPAHRGEEITEEVLESDRSVVWTQVRHRTSAMCGVLRWMKE